MASGGDCSGAINKAQQDRSDLQTYRDSLVDQQGEATDPASRAATESQIKQANAQIRSADTAIADGKLIAAGGDYTAANLTDEERKAIGFALDPVGASGVRLFRQRDINTVLRLIGTEVPKPNADATFPRGSLRNPMGVKQGTNEPQIIGNTPHSGHSLDQMQGRGIPLSIVKNVMK